MMLDHSAHQQLLEHHKSIIIYGAQAGPGQDMVRTHQLLTEPQGPGITRFGLCYG